MIGFPCSGKTTIAKMLQQKVPHLVVLDGDEVRELFSSKDFSREGCVDHNRRVAYIAKFLVGYENPVVVSLISPYKQKR